MLCGTQLDQRHSLGGNGMIIFISFRGNMVIMIGLIYRGIVNQSDGYCQHNLHNSLWGGECGMKSELQQLAETSVYYTRGLFGSDRERLFREATRKFCDDVNQLIQSKATDDEFPASAKPFYQARGQTGCIIRRNACFSSTSQPQTIHFKGLT